ncbi:MAG: nicotinamidase [Gemmatimonadota bacterium]
MSSKPALLVVDIQPDFLPGGALPVEGGDQILDPVADLMRSDRFRLQIATQDWHPPDHVSFASRHAGRKPYDRMDLYGHQQILWPDHCIQGTPGAELEAGMPWERVDAIIRKATDPAIDSYSAFRNNWNPAGERPPTGLTGYLGDRGIEDVYICGLARDFCVKWSAEDGIEAGFRVHVLWDLTRAIYPEENDENERALRARGVEILTSERLPRGGGIA